MLGKRGLISNSYDLFRFDVEVLWMEVNYNISFGTTNSLVLTNSCEMCLKNSIYIEQ